MAYTALRWFARGGTHLNFYMWWGGYNRGRSAAAGIMNAYASDSPLCPSGQRRQPKFGHFQRLLSVLQGVAPVLLDSPTALDRQTPLRIRAGDGTWRVGVEQWGFLYQINTSGSVLFVENAGNTTETVLVPLVTSDQKPIEKEIEMEPYSSVIFVDDNLAFNSAVVQTESTAFVRKFEYEPVRLLDWTSWREPVGPPPSSDSRTREASRPIEQTQLNVEAGAWSDYAWYETDFDLPEGDSLDSVSLLIDTQEANAFVAYVDGLLVGAADTHNHLERNVTLALSIGPLKRGPHRLSLLSESLGYSNLIGRWGASTKAKTKGITGDVALSTSRGSSSQGQTISLCDGRTWRSFAGLHGEQQLQHHTFDQFRIHPTRDASSTTSSRGGGRWYSARFETPNYDPAVKALFLDITQGRGHLWLNQMDLGRYWNITRGNTNEYSQRYYFLPHDYLRSPDGRQWNELVWFDAFGGSPGGSIDHHREATRLLLSWIELSSIYDTETTFQDAVDFPLACI